MHLQALFWGTEPVRARRAGLCKRCCGWTPDWVRKKGWIRLDRVWAEDGRKLRAKTKKGLKFECIVCGTWIVLFSWRIHHHSVYL